MNMAEKITVYQCPACTGPLSFDGKIGKLKCEYCGSTYTTQEIEALQCVWCYWGLRCFRCVWGFWRF